MPCETPLGRSAAHWPRCAPTIWRSAIKALMARHQARLVDVDEVYRLRQQAARTTATSRAMGLLLAGLPESVPA